MEELVRIETSSVAEVVLVIPEDVLPKFKRKASLLGWRGRIVPIIEDPVEICSIVPLSVLFEAGLLDNVVVAGIFP
jgi:hypothetical protein